MCDAGQEFVGGNDIVSCLLLFLSLVSFHILPPSPVSSLLLLSPVSSSVSFSYLTSIVSSLPSFVLQYVFCRLFHSPVSHLIFHQSWADMSVLRISRPRHIFHVCMVSFVTASRLSHLLRIQMHSVDAMGEDTTVLKKHSWASLLLKVTSVKR